MVFDARIALFFTWLNGSSYKIKSGYRMWLTGKGLLMIKYKVVELSVVTDESLEDVLNQLSAKGWHFDGIQFVVREASKRPSMAFVIFTRDIPDEQV